MDLTSFKKRKNSLERDNYPTSFFFTNRWILIGAGLWQPNTQNPVMILLYKLYSYAVVVFFVILYTLTEFGIVYDTAKHGMEAVIKNLSFAMTHGIGAVKVFHWYYNRKRIYRIMELFEDKYFHYERFNDFKPALNFEHSKKQSRLYSLIFFTFAHMTVGSAYIPPAIRIIQDTITNPEHTLDYNQRLPYFSWIPFDYTTRFGYGCALAIQFFPTYSYIYLIVGLDTLFMSLMSCLSGHLTILQGAMKTVRQRALLRMNDKKILTDGLYDSKELDNEMKYQMKRSINHLQTIIEICDELERIYTYLTLIQVLATLFIVCTCLFLVSTTPVGSSKFVNELVYLGAMAFQLVLYCWFGNEVFLESSGLPMAIYEGDWLSSSQEYKQLMLITMKRMVRPLRMTAGKFAPLTLTTFVTILRGSYSFFAVLKNVDTEEALG